MRVFSKTKLSRLFSITLAVLIIFAYANLSAAHCEVHAATEESVQSESELAPSETEKANETARSAQEEQSQQTGKLVSTEKQPGEDVPPMAKTQNASDDQTEATASKKSPAASTATDKASDGADAADASQSTSEKTKWDISKSKEATQLEKQSDGTYTSNVTLSLPAASYKKNLDVAFVLDGSTSADKKELTAAAKTLLEQLESFDKLLIKVSLTIFGGSIPILEDTDLVDISVSDNIKAMLTDPSYDKKPGRSGSNLQAGIEAARKKLNADTAVDSADKYMIILTDGAPRMWVNSSGQAMSQTFVSDGNIYWNSNEDFLARYGTNMTDPRAQNLPEFAKVWTDGQSGKKIDEYGMTAAEKNQASKTDVAQWSTIKDINQEYYTTYEAAMYNAAKSLNSAKSEANLIVVTYPYKQSTKTYYHMAESFKDWAGKNCATRYDSDSLDPGKIFENIKNEMINLLDAGSTVEDTIGHTADYNFDFVDDASKLRLTVAGETYTTVSKGNGIYWFIKDGVNAANGADAPFVLHYNMNGSNSNKDEHFILDINVPITKDATAQLTYTVKLTNPKTQAGTYGKYDKDGSMGYSELFTNNSAVLYPVDSKGNKGEAEAFAKPTVSYTVESSPADTDKPAATDDPSENKDPDGPKVSDGKDQSDPKVSDKISDGKRSDDTKASGNKNSSDPKGVETGDDFAMMAGLLAFILSALGLAVSFIFRGRQGC